MGADNAELIEVLQGNRPDGLTWRVLAGGDAANLHTYVDRRIGDARAVSGFQGPALYSGQLINSWSGRADGLPPFVIVRTGSTVVAVTAVSATGREYALTLSDVIEPFGLRFGAAPLPAAESIIELRVESASDDA
ncbi:MAG TPA: hypothetical protein VFR11_22965 [Micromonosporaceae bacterium]|nr:hypothetical protein [Micromonosporaceae bacterium]